MAERSKPPFRAEVVGSLLRPQALKDAFRDAAIGRIDQDRFREIQDHCICEAVALQQDVGLPVVTDGEFRRGSWFYGFVQAVEGLGTARASFDFQDLEGGHARFETAYANAKLRRTRGITTDEFAFVQGITQRVPKVTMPAPSLAHFFRPGAPFDSKVYRTADEFWSDLIAVYRAELAELARLGCTYVQLDEVPCAMLCDPKIRDMLERFDESPDRLLDTYIDAINKVTADRPAGMTIALHLCRGNYKGQWMAEGGYEPVAQKLFERCAVDAFFLEYDTRRAGGFEPLRYVPDDKHVVLGLISTKTPMLEHFDSLRRRVDEASKFVPLERLGVSPQCGFASSVGGNPLTIDDEKRKLERVVELARAVGMSIRFDNKVAIVTGAGSGLGRAHVLGLAALGAKVVVNDLGGAVDGSGASSAAARAVVAEIEAAGGTAMADGANVTDFAQVSAMVARAVAAWGRVDILVNNAGILRDKSFAKMELADFRAVIDVHLMGAVNCTKAVWDGMRERNYGRIVFTSSASGLYGNFGQANYGAAKAGVVGLMNVLTEEGRKHDIRVNALAPVAATRMTEGILPPGTAELMQPEEVTPAVLFLASDQAPTGVILAAGAGSYARTAIVETPGIYLAPGERTPDAIADQFDEISDLAHARVMPSAGGQTAKYLERAMKASGTK